MSISADDMTNQNERHRLAVEIAELEDRSEYLYERFAAEPTAANGELVKAVFGQLIDLHVAAYARIKTQEAA